MSTRHFSAILWLVVSLTSCEELVVEYPIEDQAIDPADEQKRYNIVSAISPERDAQWVLVTQFDDPSSHLNDYFDYSVPDGVSHAKVAIQQDKGTFRILDTVWLRPEEGGDSIAVAYRTNGDFTVAGNSRYTLRVEVDDAVFTASCRAPRRYVREVLFDGAEYDLLDNLPDAIFESTVDGRVDTNHQTEAYVYVYLTIKISFRDVDASQDNFYAIEGYSYETFHIGQGEHGEDLFREAKRPLENAFPGRADDLTRNNYNRRGKMITTTFEKYDSYASGGSDPLSVFHELDSLEFHVLTLSKTAYDYKRIEQLGVNRGGIFNEPQVMPSNIEKAEGSKRIGAQGFLRATAWPG